MSEEPNAPTNGTNSESDDAAGEDSDHWEKVGRQLLQEELDNVAYNVIEEAFRNARARIAAGEELTAEDIGELRDASEKASRVAEMAAEASPEAASQPGIWDYLDEQGRREYIRDLKKQHPDDIDIKE